MNTKNMNKGAYFAVTFFLGFLGVHKFIDGKTGMGILYLLTCGLFGIGWLIDSIKALIMLFKNDTPAAPVAPAAPQGNATYSKIVGVTFPCSKNSAINRQDVIAQLRAGDRLYPELYTYEGKPAIMLLNAQGLDAGNLSADLAADLYDKPLGVAVSEVTGGGELSYGCNIIITY